MLQPLSARARGVLLPYWSTARAFTGLSLSLSLSLSVSLFPGAASRNLRMEKPVKLRAEMPDERVYRGFVNRDECAAGWYLVPCD